MPSSHFTGDLPAAKWVRFVRSPIAAGRIVRVLAPDGVMVVTATEVCRAASDRPDAAQVQICADRPTHPRP